MEGTITILEILKYLLTAVGILTVAWGVYDMFGDNGNQSSMGVKKIIGGAAFGIIGFVAMQLVITNIQSGIDQANSADITSALIVLKGLML